MALFWASNIGMQTTAAPATTTTTTAIRTMLQVATPSTSSLRVVAFGVEFSAALANVCTVELIDTISVAATVTTHVAAGVQPYDGNANGGASVVTLGTSATGYNASGEGTVTATRTGKVKILPVGATSYEWEWSLGREFFVPVSHFLRIRMTANPAVSAYCWALWEE